MRQESSVIVYSHSYGGHTARVHISDGNEDIFSAMSIEDIDIWLRENYPEAVEIFRQT